eukprot:TRINITY_DN40729_c0_g1_i1.p1 TRINITY_DN40729_c0_g1~~TRINITY_DN40729_c0_g1_i1.p1  ORF type:complete len:1294 (-),score=244.51 TRINITY_DN40729_c0_g1_i1:298-4179(-)
MAAGVGVRTCRVSNGAAAGAETHELPPALFFHDLDGLIALTRGPARDVVGEKATDALGPDAIPEAAATAQANIIEQLRVLPSAEQEAFWSQVLVAAGTHLSSEQPPPTVPQTDANGNSTDSREHVGGEAVHSVAYLLAAFAQGALPALAALAVAEEAGAQTPHAGELTEPQNLVALPPSFAEAAERCQDKLLTTQNIQTQALIADALERICTGPFAGREIFYGGILMYLVGRCLQPGVTAADVERLFKMRGLLGELDWEHQSIESMKFQLMRCLTNPSFARATRGPDLIAVFYTVHPSFTAEVNSTVKNQAIYSREAALKAYGIGLFRAWKGSEGGMRLQMEECAQEWTTLAVRAPRKSADKARIVLEEFHRHHHEKTVGELLCGLYGPVLWRSLKVANAQVRENSARLLQYVLPLFAGDMGVAEQERELAKQLRLLRETLEDPAEPVRRVGVGAVCVIIKNYWDVMPPADTAALLKTLMDKCAHDKKAPLVRAAVAEGLGWILDQPLSHPTMSAVLPKVADLLTDKSPVVRAAFVGLLGVVSSCRGITIQSVVRHEELLVRLSCEHAEGQAERLQRDVQPLGKKVTSESHATPDFVAKQLTKLMVPSLFGQDLVQQVTRCQLLLQQWPLALLALLTHAQEIVPLPIRVKLAAALFRCGIREVSDAAAAAEAGSVEGTTGSRPRLLGMLFRIVGILLEGASEKGGPAKKKGSKAGKRPPKKLHDFIYEHFREDDFLPFLQAKTATLVAESFREGILFAMSSLDPTRLKQTAELVRSELKVACLDGGESVSAQRLMTLLRVAARWGFLSDALKSAWERILAVVKRLKHRQEVRESVVGALTAVEMALRETELRRFLLPAEAETIVRVASAVADAMASAIVASADEWQRAASARVGMPEDTIPANILGLAAPDVWPRMFGLATRSALHVKHRCAAIVSTPVGDSAVHAGALARTSEDASISAGSPSLTQAAAVQVLENLASTLCCSKAHELLQCVEAAASAKATTTPPPAKKPRGRKSISSTPPPSLEGLDAILQLHERLLESLSADRYLYVLHSTASVPEEHSQTLEERLWRWAAAADTLQTRDEGGPRFPRAWSFSARLLQQALHGERPLSDVVEAAKRLLARVTSDVPAEDTDLRGTLQLLFSRVGSEPRLVQLVSAILGPSGVASLASPAGDVTLSADSLAAANAAAPSPSVAVETGAYSPRVATVVNALLPNFSVLRAKLLSPHDEAAGDNEDRRYASGLTSQRRESASFAEEEQSQAGESLTGDSLFDEAFPEQSDLQEDRDTESMDID